MKAYMSGGMAPFILILITRWKLEAIITLWPVYPREKVPGTRLITGWVCPREGPNAFEKGSLALAAIRTSDRPSHSLIAILITASLQNGIIIMNC